ncbi:MAG: dihydrofolate reductase [Rubrivivax sp.]|nr:dihydrofolate reductase [Rubrivivax sp.]
MKITLVAAVAADGGIGRGNELLFGDAADRRHFRDVTMGKPVVMGRRTWLSLPERFRPLPGRRNVVLSRDPGFRADGAETAASLDAALALLATEPEVCVVGGGEIYAQALPRADELQLTEVARSWPEADVHFPPLDAALFEEVGRVPQRAADGTPFAFVTYRRRRR